MKRNRKSIINQSFLPSINSMMFKNNKFTPVFLFGLVVTSFLLACLIWYFFIVKNSNLNSNLEDKIVTVFSPNSKNIVLSILDSAERFVDIQVYSITSDDIVDKLIELKKRGVRVRIIVDANIDKYEKVIIEKLRKNGIQVLFLDFGKYVMHSKFIIIDEKAVFVGSINLSEAALKGNREAAVYIKDENTAKKFLKIFESDAASSTANYKDEPEK
ncbi:MAG: phospholipase D-like domain-containing protein [Candidatus Micrarchaeota archaeon]|nr:phospholipase D-like domain-containing protein [Candidatus Micrarchaeota archaeon]